jgi:hypothetical protein
VGLTLQYKFHSAGLTNNISNNGLSEIIILLLLFYGCKTWSLTLREERTLRVFENRVLKRISGSKGPYTPSNPTQSDHRFKGVGLLPHCPISSSDHVSTVVIAVSFSMAQFLSKFQKTGLDLTTLSLLQNPPPPKKRIVVEKVVKRKRKIYPFSIIERTGLLTISEMF